MMSKSKEKSIPVYADYNSFYCANTLQPIKRMTEQTKKIEATIWVCNNFPVCLPEFIPILYLISLSNKNIAKFIDFFSGQSSFQKDFPTLVSLPIIIGFNIQYQVMSFKLVSKACGFTKDEMKYDKLFLQYLPSPLGSIKSSIVSIYDDTAEVVQCSNQPSLISYDSDSLSYHDIDEIRDDSLEEHKESVNTEIGWIQKPPPVFKIAEPMLSEWGQKNIHNFRVSEECSENIRDSITISEKVVPPIRGLTVPNNGSKYFQEFTHKATCIPDIPIYSAVKIHDKWRQNEVLHTIESRSSSHSNDDNNEESTQRSKQSIFRNYAEGHSTNVAKLSKPDIFMKLSKCLPKINTNQKKTEDTDIVIEV